MKTKLKNGRPRAIIDPRTIGLVNWLTTGDGQEIARQLQLSSALGVHESIISRILRPRGAGFPSAEVCIDGARYVSRTGFTALAHLYNEGKI